MQEELTHQKYDNQLSAGILAKFGPLTLLLFNRLLEVSHRYSEFKELRLYPLKKNLKHDLANQMSKRLMNFVAFCWHMSLKDVMYQWRIQKLVRILPSAEEMKVMLKQFIGLEINSEW